MQDYNLDHYYSLLDSNKIKVDGHTDFLVPLEYVKDMLRDILSTKSEGLLTGLDKAMQEYKNSLQDLHNILNETKKLQDEY